MSCSTVCGRALPSTCVTDGNDVALFGPHLRRENHERRIAACFEIFSRHFRQHGRAQTVATIRGI